MSRPAEARGSRGRAARGAAAGSRWTLPRRRPRRWPPNRDLRPARRPRLESCGEYLRSLQAERLDVAAPVRLAVRAQVVRALRLPAVRAELDAWRRDPVLRA